MARIMEGGGSSNDDMSVICGDICQTMIETTKQRIEENHWRAEVETIDAQVLQLSLIPSENQSLALTV